MRLLLALILAASALPAAVSGDAARGAQVFKDQRCVTCHAIRGEGGKSAPDLGRRGSRDWSPQGFAALVWNHAPAMWSAMDAAGVARPRLSQQDAADLYAYFFSIRAFDPPGDAGRGRKFFVAKGCAECHNISSTSAAGGTAVIRWESLTDVIEVARQMWNHAPQMQAAAAKKDIKLPQLTVAEMNDILVYLNSLPQVRNAPPVFAPASPDTGATLFDLKGCQGCHTAQKVAPGTGGIRSMAELAVTMWNHAGSMKQSSPLNSEEMRRIVGYLWNQQLESAAGGNAARGQKVLAAKGCATCHTSGPGPALAGKGTGAYEIVSAVWAHGPAMKKEMDARKLAWPRMTEHDMQDLLAALH